MPFVSEFEISANTPGPGVIEKIKIAKKNAIIAPSPLRERRLKILES